MKYFGRQCDQLTLVSVDFEFFKAFKYKNIQDNKKLTEELKTKTAEYEREIQELKDEKEEVIFYTNFELIS